MDTWVNERDRKSSGERWQAGCSGDQVPCPQLMVLCQLLFRAALVGLGQVDLAHAEEGRGPWEPPCSLCPRTPSPRGWEGGWPVCEHLSGGTGSRSRVRVDGVVLACHFSRRWISTFCLEFCPWCLGVNRGIRSTSRGGRAACRLSARALHWGHLTVFCSVELDTLSPLRLQKADEDLLAPR